MMMLLHLKNFEKFALFSSVGWEIYVNKTNIICKVTSLGRLFWHFIKHFLPKYKQTWNAIFKIQKWKSKNKTEIWKPKVILSTARHRTPNH